MATKIKTNDLQAALGLGIFKTLSGKSFCMTGTMSVSRTQLEGIISFLDGENHAAVKSHTSMLITPNGEFTQGSKYRAAIAQGTVVITEQEFCEMILPSIDELRGNNVQEGSH